MKNRINFWLDAALTILFVLTVISVLGGGRPNQSATATSQLWDTIHYLSGALMALGSIAHLILHWDWIKAVILRRVRHLTTVRVNRTIDLWLFGIFAVCGLTGIVSWTFPTLTQWAGMHRLSGWVMLLIIGLHLARHWKWLAQNAKRYLGLAKERAICS